ncbi:MAG: hypothetical protein HOK52_03005 [Candidatus Marinimicrobia bacterium]|nr:hypothetical protein [Alphaproteobacteria bacterium]MBT6470208.1 hypothetical protein [Candidatus Neomarinimicrobiota bacterium]
MISQHWSGFVITLYLALFWFSINVIFPLEASVFGNLSGIASILFLPHAVRVLSAWLLGPKVLFALIPAEIIAHSIWGLEFSFPVSVLIPVFSAISPVVGFETLRLLGYNVYPNSFTLPNWKGVIIAGMIASLFNSFTGAFLKGELIASGQVHQVIIRFIVGDIAGLIFCMIFLILIFRTIDKFTAPTH